MATAAGPAAQADAGDEDGLMPSVGVSASTPRGHDQTLKLFEVFRNSSEERMGRFQSPLFDELDEEKVREKDTYARSTYFI